MKHDWSLVKLGGILCRYCHKVMMPHNEDDDCDASVFSRMSTEEIQEMIERCEED